MGVKGYDYELTLAQKNVLEQMVNSNMVAIHIIDPLWFDSAEELCGYGLMQNVSDTDTYRPPPDGQQYRTYLLTQMALMVFGACSSSLN